MAKKYYIVGMDKRLWAGSGTTTIEEARERGYKVQQSRLSFNGKGFDVFKNGRKVATMFPTKQLVYKYKSSKC